MHRDKAFFFFYNQKSCSNNENKDSNPLLWLLNRGCVGILFHFILRCFPHWLESKGGEFKRHLEDLYMLSQLQEGSSVNLRHYEIQPVGGETVKSRAVYVKVKVLLVMNVLLIEVPTVR